MQRKPVSVLLVSLLVYIFVYAGPSLLTTDSKLTDKDYRLPTRFIPLSYEIKLYPLLPATNRTLFLGEVQITIRDMESERFSEIVVHCEDIKIIRATLTIKTNTTSNESVTLKHVTDEVTNFCKFEDKTNATEYEANRDYVLYIKYRGYHRDDMHGFYRSQYKDTKGKTRWLAVTNLKPVSARRVFPCFDEPALKATFNISVKRKRFYNIMSNMPLAEKVEEWNFFQLSPLMPTYTVCIIVSSFKRYYSKSATLWMRKNAAGKQGSFSIKLIPSIIRKMATFLRGFQFPSPKTELVALPDFPKIATENWGLYAFREDRVLYTESECSAENKQQVAMALAHVVAHQWFGNAVTPKWWNESWLSEGFATYFEYHNLAKVKKYWRMSHQFVVQIHQVALLADVDTNVDYRIESVDSPEGIKVLHGEKIRQFKAAAIIRMLYHILGDWTFREGLKNYLDTHNNSHTTGNDLYSALNDAYIKKHPMDLELAMKQWIGHSSFPFLDIMEQTNKNLLIIQKPFKWFTGKVQSYENLWTVPLTYTYEGGAFNVTTPQIWMKTKILNISRPTSNMNKWYLFNVQETALYRVNYPINNWMLLMQFLKSKNFLQIKAMNRAQILDDAMNLARAGFLDYTIALDISQYLYQETNYNVWYSALRNFEFLHYRLMNKKAYPLLQFYLFGLLERMYDRLKFTQGERDSHVTRLHRMLTLRWLCNLSFYGCKRTALAKFNLLLDKRGVPPDLRRVVYCTTLRYVDSEAEWNFLWNRYLETSYSSEKRVILQSLGCSLKRPLLFRLLTMVLKAHPDIRRQDYDIIFTDMLDIIPEGAELAFRFLRENIKEISKKPKFPALKIIAARVNWINTHFDYTEMVKILESDDFGAYREESNRYLISARANLRWVKDYESVIENWLEHKMDNNRRRIGNLKPSTTNIHVSWILGISFLNILL